MENNGDFTILELAEKALHLEEGGKSKLVFHLPPKDNLKQHHPYISLVNAKLALEPEVALEDSWIRQSHILESCLLADALTWPTTLLVLHIKISIYSE